jgi:hypothetical protein
MVRIIICLVKNSTRLYNFYMQIIYKNMPKYTDYRNDKVDTTPGTPTTMGGDYFYDKSDKRDKTEYRRRYKKTQKRTHKKTHGGRKKTHKRTDKRHRRNKQRR